MKKLRKISLILALTLSLCAFGSCSSSDKSSSESEDKTSEIVINDREPVTSKDKTIVIENDDEEEENEAPSAEEDAPVKNDNSGSISLGEVSGNVYTSQFSGLKITAPEGFKIVNGDDLQEIMGTGASLTGLEDTMDLLSLVTVNDAAIINSTNGENITIVYENLAKTVPDPTSYTIENYLEDSVKAAEQNGITLEAGEPEIADLGGRAFYTRSQSITLPNMAVAMESEVYVRRIDDFMLVITYSHSPIGEDTAGDYMEWFSALE